MKPISWQVTCIVNKKSSDRGYKWGQESGETYAAWVERFFEHQENHKIKNTCTLEQMQELGWEDIY